MISMHGTHKGRRTARAFTIVDLLVAIMGTCLLVGLTLPALHSVSCDAMKVTSMSNLAQLGAAHAAYAADWDDRQFTLARDDLGASQGRCEDYWAAVGCHPPVILGEDCAGTTWGFLLGCDEIEPDCDGFWAVSPMNFFGGDSYTGSFRLPNARGFHEYVNGRFFDPVFYAPKDEVVLDLVAPFFDEPCEFVPTDIDLVFSASYVRSPAALFDPAVMDPDVPGDPDLNGWQNPNWLNDGYRAPAESLALYPSQKTRMLEHHWLQRPAEPCNPGFADGPYDGCQPYFFNHSLRSNPVTLFYDGHVRGLSTMEALMSDARVRNQDAWEVGLWSRDTPFGVSGYFSEYGYDLTETSFHILTTGGIRGRDTVK